jgi:hypothetical protein
MEILIFWIALSIIVAVAASRRFNRDAVGWFFIAVLISPLLAVLLLFALGPLPRVFDFSADGRLIKPKSFKDRLNWFLWEM